MRNSANKLRVLVDLFAGAGLLPAPAELAVKVAYDPKPLLRHAPVNGPRKSASRSS